MRTYAAAEPSPKALPLWTPVAYRVKVPTEKIPLQLSVTPGMPRRALSREMAKSRAHLVAKTRRWTEKNSLIREFPKILPVMHVVTRRKIRQMPHPFGP